MCMSTKKNHTWRVRDKPQQHAHERFFTVSTGQDSSAVFWFIFHVVLCPLIHPAASRISRQPRTRQACCLWYIAPADPFLLSASVPAGLLFGNVASSLKNWSKKVGKWDHISRISFLEELPFHLDAGTFFLTPLTTHRIPDWVGFSGEVCFGHSYIFLFLFMCTRRHLLAVRSCKPLLVGVLLKRCAMRSAVNVHLPGHHIKELVGF